MADKRTPPEGASEVQYGTNGADDVPEAAMTPDSEVTARVVSFSEGESADGYWARLRLNTDDVDGMCYVDDDGNVTDEEVDEGDLVDYFAKGNCKRACRDDDVSTGDLVWIAQDGEESTFTNDEGEEVTYNKTRFAPIDGGA